MKRNTSPPRLGAPRSTQPSAVSRSLLDRARHRLHRLTVTALFVGTLAFTLLVSTGTSQEATAATNSLAAIGPSKCDFAPSQNQHWEPSQPGAGSDGFLYPSEYINEGSAATPLEKYGMRGMTWSLTSYSGDVSKVDSDDDQDCQFMAPIQNMMAQEMLTASQSVASITIAVRQKATDAGPFMAMLRDATPTTNDALRNWFIPGAGIMVVLTGIWMIMKSGGGERRSVISGVVWMVGAVFVVGWLMMPTSLANGRSGSSCQGKECDIAFDGGTTGSDGVAEGETPIYNTDPNYYALTAKANDTGNDIANAATGIFAPRTSAGECSEAQGKKDAGARTLDCVLWYEMAFRPWAVGQFGGLGESKVAWSDPADRDPKPPKSVIEGMSENKGATNGSGPYAKAEKPKDGEDVRLIMLRSQTFSWQEANATGMPRNVNGVIDGGRDYTGSPNRVTPDADKDDHEIWDATTKNGLWNQTRAYMAGEQPRSYGTWSGQAGVGDRTSTAFLSIIGNCLIAAFVLVTSLLTLMWYAVVVMALMALPFVGLISIFPPAQKFLRGLGQLWIKGLILAGVFTILQVGVGAIAGTVMASNAAFGWKVVLLFAAVLGLFKVARLAREDAFTPNLGSAGFAESIDPQNAVNRTSPVVAGAGFAAGRGATRLAGRGAAKAGGAAKQGGVRVSKGAQKAATKGKESARTAAGKARNTRYGRKATAFGDTVQGKATDITRSADSTATRITSVNGRLSGPVRAFADREDRRDEAETKRDQRREAMSQDASSSASEREVAARHRDWRAREGRARLDGHRLHGPSPQPPAARVPEDEAPSRTSSRVSDSGTTPTAQQKRPTRRTSAPSGGRAEQATPTQRPARTSTGPDNSRPPQPKVSRRENPGGTRLSATERKRLAEETAREVAKKQQRESSKGGGSGRVK